MEYELSLYDNLSSCNREGNIIELGKEFINAKNILSNKDFDIFLSDSITHEFLHSLIIRDFDITTSKLFDTIEHLCCNYSIKYQVLRDMQIKENDNYPRTWHYSVLKDGLQDFYNIYHIDNISLIQSYIVCNKRLKGGE